MLYFLFQESSCLRILRIGNLFYELYYLIHCLKSFFFSTLKRFQLWKGLCNLNNNWKLIIIIEIYYNWKLLIVIEINDTEDGRNYVVHSWTQYEGKSWSDVAVNIFQFSKPPVSFAHKFLLTEFLKRVEPLVVDICVPQLANESE